MAWLGKTLLPIYSEVLIDVSGKQDDEIFDSLCFICNCLEYGNARLFDQTQGEAGPKLIELIEYGFQDK